MWQAIAADRISKIKIHKVIRIALLVVFLLIAFRYALPHLKKLIEELKKSKEKQHVEELEDAVNEEKLSYPIAQYGIWADTLYSAMKGLGTDEQAIYNVFGSMKTNNDVAQLVVSFGVRSDETLAQWLRSDLSETEMGMIRRILSERNITYNVI